MSHSKHQRPATISQITKCVKKNMHNVQINLKVNPEFEESTDFKIYREIIEVDIETSLASKSINEDKTSLVYKENEIIEIPRKLNEYFDNKLDTNYYIYGVPRENSFFHSLLYVVSKDFKLKTPDVRVNYVNTLKESMIEKLPGLFRSNSYSKYGYKRGAIIENIENCDLVSEGLICFASDFFNVNLVILNYDNEKYLMGKEYNDSINEKNVVVIYSNGVYLPVIHIYGELLDNFIYKCVVNRFKLNKKLATQTELSVVEQEVAKTNTAQAEVDISTLIQSNANTNENTITQVLDEPTPGEPVLGPVKISLKAFSGYKLPELVALADKYGISTTNDINGKIKPKTKRALYDELSAL